jgi:hypothetical protein
MPIMPTQKAAKMMQKSTSVHLRFSLSCGVGGGSGGEQGREEEREERGWEVRQLVV